MKKIIYLIAGVFLITSASVNARPLRSGIYASTKTGAMRVEMKRDGKKSDDMSFPFSLALGMRIRHFRLEAEYTVSTAVKDDKYEQETETIMAQMYYDVPFKSAIRPYVNAGIGHHETTTELQNVFDEDKKGTAWNIGGGVTWNLSNASNLDIGYRLLDIGELKTPSGKVKTKYHFMYLGWRYVF